MSIVDGILGLLLVALIFLIAIGHKIFNRLNTLLFKEEMHFDDIYSIISNVREIASNGWNPTVQYKCEPYKSGDGIDLKPTNIKVKSEESQIVLDGDTQVVDPNSLPAYLEHRGAKGKPVRCINTGEEFISQKEAANYYGFKQMVLSLHLHGHCTHAGTDTEGNELTWERIEKQNAVS